jgi:hypothetical protein
VGVPPAWHQASNLYRSAYTLLWPACPPTLAMRFSVEAALIQSSPTSSRNQLGSLC